MILAFVMDLAQNILALQNEPISIKVNAHEANTVPTEELGMDKFQKEMERLEKEQQDSSKTKTIRMETSNEWPKATTAIPIHF